MSALLSAVDVEIGYGREEPLLRDWSAEFSRGQTTAITAPSGAGKSTLLYVLGLMLTPLAGRIEIDGAAASVLPDVERSRCRALRYGFVFQDAVLDPTRTVLDNVLESSLYRGDDPRTRRDHAHTLLERFGVSLREDARPGEVSGGQAQRIALCRALLNEPDIVLADEPTGNLDAESAAVVASALHEHATHGATVIIATHDAALAHDCDRVIQL